MNPVVLVLASGRGERFIASGGTGSKLDALLSGKSVLCRTLDAVRSSGLPWHIEEEGHAGMGDSIAAAVRKTQHAAGWLVLPGDLPLIRAQSLLRVAAALPGSSVVLPRYQGRRGHPVGFAPQCMEALLALRGERGAWPIVESLAANDTVVELALDDPGIVADIDTLADLLSVQKMLDLDDPLTDPPTSPSES